MIEFKVLNEEETEVTLEKVSKLLTTSVEKISEEVGMNPHSLMLFLFYALASDIGRFDRKNMREWLLRMVYVQDALEQDDDKKLEELSDELNKFQEKILQNIALAVHTPEGNT